MTMTIGLLIFLICTNLLLFLCFKVKHGDILSINTLIISFYTYLSQKKTERNTIPIFSEKSQENEFRILIRSLLRNFVESIAIWRLVEDSDYKKYPSEIYFSSQIINVEKLNLHLFYKYEELTPALSELIFRLNKYNCNLKILNSHMPNKEISKEVKREELERFSIQEVFNVLHGINSFLLKAYKKETVCYEEIMAFYRHWEEDSRIKEAFALDEEKSWNFIQNKYRKDFSDVKQAINNEEFKRTLQMLKIPTTDIEKLISNIVICISAYKLGLNTSFKIVMIGKKSMWF